jgi:hypothetical protein
MMGESRTLLALTAYEYHRDIMIRRRHLDSINSLPQTNDLLERIPQRQAIPSSASIDKASFTVHATGGGPPETQHETV